MRQPNLNILAPWWRSEGACREGGFGSRWQHRRQVLLDHFGLVAGLLLLVCALLWAAVEHSRHVAELRVAETNRHIAAFHEPPVGEAWQRVADAWQARQAAQTRAAAPHRLRLGRGFARGAAQLPRVRDRHRGGAPPGAGHRYRDPVLPAPGRVRPHRQLRSRTSRPAASAAPPGAFATSTTTVCWTSTRSTRSTRVIDVIAPRAPEDASAAAAVRSRRAQKI